jgi:hypothetical protein
MNATGIQATAETKKAANAAFDVASNTGSLGRCFCAAFVVLLTEFLNATCGIHNLLGAGVERMALGADFDMQRLRKCRTCCKFVTATAGDCNLGVSWVNVGFHVSFFHQ